MHYLKESLVSEATTTLVNLAVSEEGYKEAWSRVISKYDNKRLIIHTHFNDLFGAEKLKNESGLRNLVDRFDSTIRGFRICGQNPENWSPVLSYKLYTRLDNKTRNDFRLPIIPYIFLLRLYSNFAMAEPIMSNSVSSKKRIRTLAG